MEQIMRKILAVLLAELIAVVAAFAVGAFTVQEAYAEVPIDNLFHRSLWKSRKGRQQSIP